MTLQIGAPFQGLWLCRAETQGGRGQTQGGARGFAVSLPLGWCVAPFQGGWRCWAINRPIHRQTQGGRGQTQGGARGFAVSLPLGWCVAPLQAFRAADGGCQLSNRFFVA